jgi:cytochrome bd ubiquinol oxidase subunit II
MIEYWTGALALMIFLYVVLDGFDLGVGMLLAFVPDEAGRRRMLGAISPVWDGNETWLVLTVSVLFGIYPLVYSVLLSAFYLPLIAMLCGLILRGVSFEFREKSLARRRFWDGCFIFGSIGASFIQGVAVGAIVQGLPTDAGRYVGGLFGWCSPFALLCGFGLCAGYALLGAGWLAYKGTNEVRDFGFRLLPRLLGAVLCFLVIAFISALMLHLRVMDRWLERPILWVFPVVGVLACIMMAHAIRRRSEALPFLCGLALFASAFCTLAVSFYPYMIPFSITIADAAAPHSSQAFLFWGAGLVVLPITLIYTVVVYAVFRGKVVDEDETYSS